jgi:hypothetical protein
LGIVYIPISYPIPIPKYSIFLGILSISIEYIPKKMSILGMGIGYWIPISYPIPNKKVGTDV